MTAGARQFFGLGGLIRFDVADAARAAVPPDSAGVRGGRLCRKEGTPGCVPAAAATEVERRLSPVGTATDEAMSPVAEPEAAVKQLGAAAGALPATSPLL